MLIIALAAALTGCSDPTKDKGYVVVSFVTYCDVVIEPIILDGTTTQYMPDDPIRAGYEFLGWYYDENFTERFTTDDYFVVDTTLYARWKQKTADDTSDDDQTVVDVRGFTYVDNGNGYTVTGYLGEETEITVLTRYNEQTVTKIAAGAFSGNESLVSISFGATILEVGEDAFRNCPSLKAINVTGGNYYYSSKNGILYNAQGTTVICAPARAEVETLVLGEEVADVMDYAFENCTFNVTVPDGGAYVSVEGYDFAGFKGKITLGASIEEIRQYAFKGASCSIVFGAECKLNTVGVGAFDGYVGATLTVPGTVTELEAGAFNGCEAVVDITRVQTDTIKSNVFQGYIGDTLLIPKGIKYIEKNAFYGSTTSITFEAGGAYTDIEELAFNGFGGSVVFPYTVATVGKNAFYGSSASVTFSCREGELEVDEAAFNQFKGTLKYLIN